MQYVLLGRTGLRVSAMGLGGGGPSRLGTAGGRTAQDAVALVRRALALGVTSFDSAPAYGTEAIVGEALRGADRASLVLSTKVPAGEQGALLGAADLERRVEASLKALGISYVDILFLHGVLPEQYPHAREVLLPALRALQRSGVLRFAGLSESIAGDPEHRMLEQALGDDCWDVAMLRFGILNQSARARVLPQAQARDVGIVAMAGIGSGYPRLREQAGSISGGDPEGVADAAYRFARDEPGVHCVLAGTGSAAHLERNARSFAVPPLEAAVRARLRGLAVSAATGGFRRAEAPVPLTGAQVEEYRRDGFVLVRDVLAPQEVAELVAEVTRLERWGTAIVRDNLRVELRKALDGRALLNKFDPVIDVSPLFDDLAIDGRITGRVASALGAPGALFKDKLVFKQQGHPGYGHHQDHAVWQPIPLPAVTVLVAFEDATGTEALEMFRGHHRAGLTMPGGEFRPGRANDMPPESDAARLATRAGDLVLFDSLLPHRSGPSTRPGPRAHLYLSYALSSHGDLRAGYYRHFRATKQAGKDEALRARERFRPQVRELKDEPPTPG